MSLLNCHQAAMKRPGLNIFFLILLIGTLQCGNPTSSIIGILQVRLSSQSVPPRHVQSVFITISQVSARAEGARAFDFSNTSPHIFDLFGLQNGITRILDLLSLPENRYDALRLTIADLTVQLTNNRQFITVFPDSQNVEIILTPLNPFTIKGERLSDVIIDFDLFRSLIPQGDFSNTNGITGYQFEPKARVVDLTTVGQIIGQAKHDNFTPSFISDDVPLPDYSITMIQPDRTDSVSVISDQDGEYTAFFMSAGSYTIVVPPTDNTRAWSVEDVVVTTANPTRQDMTVSKH